MSGRVGAGKEEGWKKERERENTVRKKNRERERKTTVLTIFQTYSKSS